MADYTLLGNGGIAECRKLAMKIVEEQDKFIIEYITPYCESVLKTPLPKEKLVETLKGNKKLQAENKRLRKKLNEAVADIPRRCEYCYFHDNAGTIVAKMMCRRCRINYGYPDWKWRGED